MQAAPPTLREELQSALMHSSLAPMHNNRPSAWACVRVRSSRVRPNCVRRHCPPGDQHMASDARCFSSAIPSLPNLPLASELSVQTSGQYLCCLSAAAMSAATPGLLEVFLYLLAKALRTETSVFVFVSPPGHEFVIALPLLFRGFRPQVSTF